MTLRLQLFGGFRLADRDGETVRISSRKSRALLAYLAVSPNRTCARDRLMTVLWGDCPETQARQSLRKELSRLRGCLGGKAADGIVTEAGQIRLKPDCWSVDVEAFRLRAGSFRIEELEAARSDYAGDFLDGFYLDEELFEEWVTEQRQELAEEAVAVLLRLASLYRERNDLEVAIRALRHALRLDPFRDDVFRQLLCLLSVAGRHTELRVAYEKHAKTLWAELAVEPDEETTRIYQTLCDQKIELLAPGLIWPPGLPDARDLIGVVLRRFVVRAGQQDCEAVTNDVLVELARFAGLSVISFEDKATRRSAPAERYLVDGELQCHGGKTTCLVTLRDNASGHLKWADRIDCPTNGAVSGSELLARKIASRLAPKITELEMSRVARQHEYLLQSSELAMLAKLRIRVGSSTGLPAHLQRGLELAERALELDESCTGALVALSWGGNTYVDFFRSNGGEAVLETARQASNKLLELEPESHLTHMRMGWQAFVGGNHDRALESLRHARALNPCDANCAAMLGFVETMSGQPVAGERIAREAISLNPRHPDGALIYGTLQAALRHQSRLAEAIKWGEHAVTIAPRNPAVRMGLMVCYAEAGFTERAGSAYVDLHRRVPAYVTAMSSGSGRIYQRSRDNERLVAAMDVARHSARRQ